MAFTSCTVAINNITSLSDTPNITDGLSSTALKAKFDLTGSDLKNYINSSLVNVLNSTTSSSSGADNIGSATISGVTGNTVWSQINSLNSNIGTLDTNKLNLSGGTLTGALALAAGTSALPSLTRGGDTDTGIYFPAVNTIGISTNGSEVARIDSSGNLGIATISPTEKIDVTGSIKFSSQLKSADGTASAPGISFSSDTNTGIFRPTTDTIGISTNGTEQARMDSTGKLSFGSTTFTSRLDTSNITPRLQVLGADRTYSSSINAQFSADGNSPALYFAKSRNATIGSHTIVQSGDDLGDISFGGSDGTNIVESARIRVEVDNTPGTNDMPGRIVFSTTADGSSTVTERMRIGSDGNIYMTMGSTTANTANMYVATTSSGTVTGLVQRSTSSIRYKTNVRNYDKGIEDVNKLRPVYYNGINDGDKQFSGFIAEEVHNSGLTEFVQYNENNEPESLAYSNMVSLLTKAIQEQQTIINSLKQRIESLESKVV